MCPRKYTVRKLKWMADSKREHDYDVAINQAYYVNQILFAEHEPNLKNPIRYENELTLIKSNSDPKGKEAFDLLGAGLSHFVMSGS